MGARTPDAPVSGAGEPAGAEGGGRPRVVIAGAGFAGLWAARTLAREGKGKVDVLLLDRNNYHTFLPLLYQVAAAELGPAEIAYPVRSVFRGFPHIDFRMAEVQKVRPADRCVVVEGGVRVSYDYLLLAMGSDSHFFGVEGAAEHAFPLLRIEEAMPLRRHILSCFERAVHEPDPAERRRLLTFTIVGGGPTGVEFGGALAELVYGPLQKDYPAIGEGEVRIVLLEAMDRVLGALPEKLGAYAHRRLERQGVEVRLDTAVKEITAREALLADGSAIASETVVWTAGVRGMEGPAAWGLPVGPRGHIVAEPTLQVEGFPEIYVAGDLAHVEIDGTAVPGVAPAAVQGGAHVASNILRQVSGKAPLPLRYSDPGMLAVIGRNAAVAHVRGRSFTGFVAWVLWLVIHIGKLIGFRNRALVLVQWAWNYISYERAVRLILPAESDRRKGA